MFDACEENVLRYLNPLFFFLSFLLCNNFSASRVPGKRLQMLHGELLLVLSLQILFCSYKQFFFPATNGNHTWSLQVSDGVNWTVLKTFSGSISLKEGGRFGAHGFWFEGVEGAQGYGESLSPAVPAPAVPFSKGDT